MKLADHEATTFGELDGKRVRGVPAVTGDQALQGADIAWHISDDNDFRMGRGPSSGTDMVVAAGAAGRRATGPAAPAAMGRLASGGPPKLNASQRAALAWARERGSFTRTDFRVAGYSANTINSLYVREMLVYDPCTRPYTAAASGALAAAKG